MFDFNVLDMGKMKEMYRGLYEMNVNHYKEFSDFIQKSMPTEMKEKLQKFDFGAMKHQSEIFGEDVYKKQFLVWQEQMKKVQDDMKKFNIDFDENTKKFAKQMESGFEKISHEMKDWHSKMSSNHVKKEPQKV